MTSDNIETFYLMVLLPIGLGLNFTILVGSAMDAQDRLKRIERKLDEKDKGPAEQKKP